MPPSKTPLILTLFFSYPSSKSGDKYRTLNNQPTLYVTIFYTFGRMSASDSYIGNELELFKHAKNWKKYWGDKVIPYLGKNILEVGAGIGANTTYLLESSERINTWVCLEPDKQLTADIPNHVSTELMKRVDIVNGYSGDLNQPEKYDTLLYIDVIEHIEDDAAEIRVAHSLLKPGGYLVILVPSLPYLYSPFDKEIGHFRRYTKKSLKQAIGESWQREKLQYLDIVGTTASLVNKWFLTQKYPTLKQIHFWDKTIVPLSKMADPILGHAIGKSLLGVWKKL